MIGCLGRTALQRPSRRPLSASTRLHLVGLASGALALSCAAGPKPADPAGPPEAEPADRTAGTDPAPPHSATPADPAEPPEGAPEPTAATTTPDPGALCERLCVRVEADCKPPAAETCRAGCKDYVQTWERCPVEVEEALACQSQAQDAMLCANVAAASCVAAFSTLARCRAGQAAPRARDAVAETGEEQERVPPGWQRTEDADLGISLLLPASVAGDGEGPSKRLVAREGDREYVVDSPPRLAGDPTDKALLKAVLDYVGTPCHKALKVHGRFESGNVVHVHFDTACKDGTHWRGMLHVSPERVIATSARSTTAFTTEDASNKLEALFYGFRFVTR